MSKVDSEPIHRAIVVCQLIYTAINLPSFMLDMAGNRIIEIPENLVDGCFCTRHAKAVGTTVDLDHAYKRLRDACVMDTSLTHCCPYGLSAITTPVKSGERPFAVVSFGPILTRNPQEILQEQVYSRADISSSDKEALSEFLYSLKRYKVDFLNSFSQIIDLALNKESDVPNAFMTPMGQSKWNESDAKNYTCPETVEAAMLYIAENYTSDISLTDVAEQVFVHPTYLSKLFNQYTSFSFRDYLNHLRITKARRLLLNPRKTIANVCFEVGFSDQSYFNRVFKAIEGITPGQYRDQNLPKKHKSTNLVQKMDAPDKFRYLRDDALMRKLTG